MALGRNMRRRRLEAILGRHAAFARFARLNGALINFD
jgi:hypothetical protein